MSAESVRLGPVGIGLQVVGSFLHILDGSAERRHKEMMTALRRLNAGNGTVGGFGIMCECGKPARARGLCQNHYKLAHKKGTLQSHALRVWYQKPRLDQSQCRTPGCTKRANHGRGLCSKHYSQQSRLGRVGSVGCPDCPASLPTARSLSIHRARQHGWRTQETQKQRRRRWYVRHTARAIKQAKDWRDNNVERANELSRLKEIRRRARKRGAAGNATNEQILARIAYYGWKCWMCGAPWEEIDHVIALARGGSNWPANLRPACAHCNHSKGHRPATRRPL